MRENINREHILEMQSLELEAEKIKHLMQWKERVEQGPITLKTLKDLDLEIIDPLSLLQEAESRIELQCQKIQRQFTVIDELEYFIQAF